MTIEGFFSGDPAARQIFDALEKVISDLGPSALRVSKSQIGFRRRRAFAWAWRPGQYLRRAGAPLVLTVALRRRDTSPRWKEVVEPASGRFTHHLELRATAEVDEQVRSWLREAWEQAG